MTREREPWFVALRDLLALVEDEHLDASVGDEKFAVIVEARRVLREAANSQAKSRP